MSRITPQKSKSTSPAVLASPGPSTPNVQTRIHSAIGHAQIAARAKVLWAAKGYPAGQDVPIWLEAEAQLKKEMNLT